MVEKKIQYKNNLRNILNLGVNKKCIICGKDTAKCHMIQKNGKKLRHLADDYEIEQNKGKVFILDLKEKLEERFELKGINEVLIFKGFCNKCDSALFREIENDTSYNSDSSLQNFLYSFKNLSYFYVKLKEEVIRSEMIYNTLPDYLKNYSNSTAKQRIECLKNFLNIVEPYFFKLKDAFFKKNYSIIKTKVYSIEKEVNLISTYCYYSFEFKTFIHFSCFPENGKTYFLLSYFSEDEQKLKSFFEDIENIKNDFEKLGCYMSSIIWNCTLESTVFSECFFNKKIRKFEKEILKKIREKKYGEIKINLFN